MTDAPDDRVLVSWNAFVGALVTSKPEMLESWERWRHMHARIRLGRNDAPVVFRDWRAAGLIDDQQLRSILLSLWEMAEFPLRTLPRRTWLEWFALAGFVSDTGATAPTEPIEVWRAQAGRVLGLSWTRDHDRANWFHKRNVETWNLSGPRLLHTFAPPNTILGVIDGGRGEREVIVDPLRLRRAGAPISDA
jgi:hypothetical protein